MKIRPLDIAIAIALAGVLAFAVIWSPAGASTGPSGLVTQNPVRVLNTRTGAKPTAGTEIVVNAARPGASAVVANVTSIGATTPGQFVTAWASGSRPDTSVLNSGVGDTIANSIIVPVAPNGTFRLYTNASAHLLVDISGYFDGGTALPPGGLSGTITGYEQVEVFSETNVLGTVSNGTSDDNRLVRIEITCPGEELKTDQVLFSAAFETLGFEVDCPGLFTSGATIKALVDL